MLQTLWSNAQRVWWMHRINKKRLSTYKHLKAMRRPSLFHMIHHWLINISMLIASIVFRICITYLEISSDLFSGKVRKPNSCVMKALAIQRVMICKAQHLPDSNGQSKTCKSNISKVEVCNISASVPQFVVMRMVPLWDALQTILLEHDLYIATPRNIMTRFQLETAWNNWNSDIPRTVC